MKRFLSVGGLFVLTLAMVLFLGCGGDDAPTDPGGGDDEPEITNLPLVPVPSSPNELIPNVSADLVVGLSDEVLDFMPHVTELRVMNDAGEVPWLAFDRRLTLACAGTLPEYTSDPAIMDDRSYVADYPRLVHERYWLRIKLAIIQPGNDSFEYQVSTTTGTSTYHEENRSFSQTMGVEVTAGGDWEVFSTSVTAYYEQTETVGEVNAVTFATEDTFTETYFVQADPTRTTVYAIWQLVDRFRLVDAAMVDIHESETLTHARISEVPVIEFLNSDVIFISKTYFD